MTASAGLLDGVGTGRERTVALARDLVSRLRVPLTVDLGGWLRRGVCRCRRACFELAALGVAGINLEDGLANARVRPVAAQVAIIRTVVTAAPGLFVNARTDAYWLGVGPEGERLG